MRLEPGSDPLWSPGGVTRLNFPSPDFLTWKKGNEKVKDLFGITGQHRVLESEDPRAGKQSLDDRIAVGEGIALEYRRDCS